MIETITAIAEAANWWYMAGSFGLAATVGTMMVRHARQRERRKEAGDSTSRMRQLEAEARARRIIRSDLMEHGRSTGKERMVAWAPESNQCWVASSEEEGRVALSRDELDFLNRADNEWEVWHNHPGGNYGSFSETDVLSLLLPGVRGIGVVDEEGRWQHGWIAKELQEMPRREQVDRIEAWGTLVPGAIEHELANGEPTSRHQRLVAGRRTMQEATQEREQDAQDCASHVAVLLGLIELKTSHRCRDSELAERVARNVEEWTGDGTWERIKAEDERRRCEEREKMRPSHKIRRPPRTGPTSAERAARTEGAKRRKTNERQGAIER